MRLVDQFERGLEAPILPDVGADVRVQPRRARTACRRVRSRATRASCHDGGGQGRCVDELARTCRSSTSTSAAASRRCGADFWELVELRDRAHGIGVKFSTNGALISPGRWRRRLAAIGLRGRADLPRRARRAEAERRGARRPGRTRRPCRAMDEPRTTAGVRGRSRSRVVVHPAQRRPARRVQGAGGLATVPSLRRDPAAPVRAGGVPTSWDDAAPADQRPAAAALPTGWSSPRRGACSPGTRSSTSPRYGEPATARAEPVRGRPGGLPDRPGRRRVRLPVRDPRQLPRRQRPVAGRVRRRLADLGAVPLAAGAAVCGRLRRPAARTTPAAAAAWQRSSSPGCRWPVPDPECVVGHGATALSTVDRLGAPRPAGSHHSHPGGVRGGPVPVTIGRRRPPQHACDESPLAGIGAGA